VVVDGRDLHVVELSHHLLAQPHVLVGVDSFNAARAAGRHEGQVLGRRGPDEGPVGFFLRVTWRLRLQNEAALVVPREQAKRELGFAADDVGHGAASPSWGNSWSEQG